MKIHMSGLKLARTGKMINGRESAWTSGWKKGAVVFLFFILTTPAYSYVGPGLGTGALAVIVGVIVSIFLAIFAVVWYPVKRLLGLGKGKKPAEEAEEHELPEEAGQGAAGQGAEDSHPSGQDKK